jgi:hypothetical protein
MITRRPTPGRRENARFIEKSACLEGKLESTLGARGSAVIIGVGVASPGTRSRRGFGEARAFLNPDLVVSILPAASLHREETNPAPTKLC